MLGFFIDGNITRLEDIVGGGGTETNCDVKVMVARWPSKSIIMLDQRGRQRAVGLAAARQGERAAGLPGGVGRPAGRGPGNFFKSQGG